MAGAGVVLVASFTTADWCRFRRFGFQKQKEAASKTAACSIPPSLSFSSAEASESRSSAKQTNCKRKEGISEKNTQNCPFTSVFCPLPCLSLLCICSWAPRGQIPTGRRSPDALHAHYLRSSGNLMQPDESSVHSITSQRATCFCSPADHARNRFLRPGLSAGIVVSEMLEPELDLRVPSPLAR